MRRLLITLATMLVATALAACGSESPSSPAGSANNPLRADSTESGAAREPGGAATAGGEERASAGEPGFQALVDAQTSHPRALHAVQSRHGCAGPGDSRWPVVDPVEAPQGPTCIYRSRAGDRVRHGGGPAGAVLGPAARARTTVRSMHGSPRRRVRHPRAAGALPGVDESRSVWSPGTVPGSPAGSLSEPCGSCRPDRPLVLRVSGLGFHRGAAREPAAAVARAHRRDRQPHGRPARAHQPAHRHLVGDGHDGAAALPRVRRRLLAARVRLHRRHLQRRGGARAARERLRRRPLAPPQGRRGRAATASRRSCKLGLLAVGTAVSAIGARRAARPHRQGHPHRAARRDDLALDAARSSSAPRSASTARWTPPAR